MSPSSRPSLLRAVGRVLALVLVGACASAARTDDDGGAPDGGRSAAQAQKALRACTQTTWSSEEGARRVLTLDDTLELYVEPRVVEAAPGGFLLAGRPTYVSSVDPAGRRRPLRPAPEIFGVVVRSGAVMPIPEPRGVGPVGWVHGTALGGGRWGFVFDELDRPSVIEGAVERVRYAEWGPGGWSEPETLAPPPGGTIAAYDGSRLYQDRGRLYWATLFVRDRGGIDVLLFERHGGRWRATTASRQWADGTALVGRPRGVPPVVVVAGLDPPLGPGGVSVRVMPPAEPRSAGASASDRSPDPRRDRTSLDEVDRITTGPDGTRFRSLVVSRDDEQSHLGWLRVNADGPSAWVVGVDSATARPPARLEAHAVWLTPVAGAGPPLWLTVAPEPETEGTRIRLHGLAANGPRLLADLPNPFEGPVRALRDGPDHVIVVGPEAQRASPTPFVRSLTLRLNLSCDSASAANHASGTSSPITRSHHEPHSRPPLPQPARPAARRVHAPGLGV